MKEIVILGGVYMLFFVFSIMLYRRAISMNKKLLYVFIPLYFVGIYFYFELINYVHILLREQGIYMEFGHASITLIMVMGFTYLTALVLLVLFFKKRNKSSSGKPIIK